MNSFFVFDCESVGLHGETFAVAGGVYLENGAAQWEFSFACPMESANGDSSDRAWVRENIPVLEITHRNLATMRDAFWKQWLRAKQDGALMAAEVAWPVEARFLHACIADDSMNRMWQGPYPLIDISSVMFAAGMDPMAKDPRTASEGRIHDPLCDARQSARLLSEAMAKLKKTS